jgi:hypothetical protein
VRYSIFEVNGVNCWLQKRQVSASECRWAGYG